MHYYCGLTVFEGIIVGGETRPWLFAFFSILSFFQSLFVSVQRLKARKRRLLWKCEFCQNDKIFISIINLPLKSSRKRQTSSSVSSTGHVGIFKAFP